MHALLSKEAEALKVPFQFTSVIGRLETLDFSNLRHILDIKFGESVAISCALQMHRLLVVDDNACCAGIAQLQKMADNTLLKQMASSLYSPLSTLNYPQTPSPQPPKLLLSFLAAVRVLKPRIMVVMEQDANHNTLLFYERFVEALKYYANLFDSLNAVASANQRRADERTRVERMVLGEEIKNILLCEGLRRYERHERLSQWAMRFKASGFDNVSLSFETRKECEGKLRSFGLPECKLMSFCLREGLKENKNDGGCLLLRWSETNLYSISAWRPDKGSNSATRERIFVQR